MRSTNVPGVARVEHEGNRRRCPAVTDAGQRQPKRRANIVGRAVLKGGERKRRITAVDGHAQTEIGGHRRLGVDAQLVQTVQHVGAGLIQGGGEDAQIGGQGRTDLHEGTAPLGAPERGSSLPVPNRRVACTVGNTRREPGPVALTVSPPSNATRVTPAATVRPRVDSGSGRVVSGAGAAHGFIDDALGHLSQFAVLGLADRPQLSERLLGAAPAASPDQADRLIDHRARRERRLQLGGQRQRVRENLTFGANADTAITPHTNEQAAPYSPFEPGKCESTNGAPQ